MKEKAFVVILKSYFIQNNIDYAAAVDNHFVYVCASRAAAKNCQTSVVDMLKEIYGDKICDIQSLDNGIMLYHDDGARNFIEIMEKDVFEK